MQLVNIGFGNIISAQRIVSNSKPRIGTNKKINSRSKR